jgi:hypothetical protein
MILFGAPDERRLTLLRRGGEGSLPEGSSESAGPIDRWRQDQGVPERVGETKIAYGLLDIRTLEAEALMASGRPGDLVLAMLANGGPDRVAEIIRRANELSASERQRVLTQMLLLCGLRRLTGRLTMELKSMGATIDIAKNEILRDWMRDGQAGLIRTLLETKYGELPTWADERLAHAKLSDLPRWAKKFVTATTLEGVLGKK